ncbi:DUF1801 domain-containing protein [Arthrobacter sp. CJ23]|uniref:DUF1801 domain-containing protein n=1 Tax=Arthrobacter sp. CJ23 TaxID=2972479 RepID=UPI00215B7BFA|nr:DUF1801 domain-containing protein [Arthrobacter sp. CJ23]UVJ38681.1 DUF1801 domain-containing protein [Arthrobacter sp. CJ23]
MGAIATIEDYNAQLAEPLAAVAGKLEPLLRTALAGAEGKMWHGHPVWLQDNEPVAGYKAYPKYVTLLFWKGQEFGGDTGELQPGTRSMASVKFADPEEVDESVVAEWAVQAARLAAK